MSNPRKSFKFNEELAKFSPRQIEAARALQSADCKYLLYGGALGGGKSYFIRWIAVRWLIYLKARYDVDSATAMIACEDYPALKDRQLQKIGKEFPSWLGKMHNDNAIYGRSYILAPEYGGGVICFRNLDDPSKYASSEFALICVDELTKNPYDIFTHLRSRLRFPGVPDMECKFVGGTNPGGIGHGWVKQFWIDGIFPDEWLSPVNFSHLFKYIPAKADDNPYLDAAYWSQLQTLPVHLRAAFRDGDWNIFAGQAFQIIEERHVIDPVPVPENAPLYMTYDWGFGKPFSIGWWWVDADGRIYRFDEWYGWNGVADEGVRLSDTDVVSGVIAREEGLGIRDRKIIRLAGPDCFQKRPDYRGGGQGPSTAEVFAMRGVYLSPGDPGRYAKIRQFRERLRITGDDEPPMIQIYSNCKQFLRTVSSLVMDKNDPEDVDTKGEDHCYDEACHIVMARPISAYRATAVLSPSDKRIEALERGGDNRGSWETYIDGMYSGMREDSVLGIPTIDGGG